MIYPIGSTLYRAYRYFQGPTSGQVDQREDTVIVPDSVNRFGATGATVNVPILNVLEWFSLLPAAAVAAATCKLYTLIGSGTPVAAQSTKGGLRLTTGATATNQAGVAGIAATGTTFPITASSFIVLHGRIFVPSLTTVAYYSAGLNQNPTDINLMATAGEGVQILADPTNILTATTGATAAQALNWIICYKINGAYSYIFTSIPVTPGVDTRFVIQMQPDLTATVTINGVLAGTTNPLATANATLSGIAGVRTNAAATAYTEIRFLQMGRSIG